MTEELDQDLEPIAAVTGTLYGIAMDAIKDYIEIYLPLASATHGFSVVESSHAATFAQRMIILGGINSPLDPSTSSPAEVVAEWERMRAIPFDVENGVTKGVYVQLRSRSENLLDELERVSKGFMEFPPEYIVSNPHMLPILQRLANISSKAELKRKIGSVSDNAVSPKAAIKLSALLNERQPGRAINRAQLLQSVEPTLEGIVRDLVGRVLLESVVAKALDDAAVAYKRESEYKSIAGVIYDFRADFVIPDDENPLAFIEVRKSSSRHASLYAKDKMFSAINWKGKNRKMLAVLVVDGPWTVETLRVMARVFDYVVPLSASTEVAKCIAAYIQGDVSKLRWLIDFSINPAGQ